MTTARLRFALPLGAFVALAVALGIGLTLRPDLIPSALIGKSAPEFSLPPIEGRTDG